MHFVVIDGDISPKRMAALLKAANLGNSSPDSPPLTITQDLESKVEEVSDENDAKSAAEEDEDEKENPTSQSSQERDGIAEEKKKEYAADGSIPEMRNLYQGHPDMYGRVNWTATYPEDLDEPPENAESAQYSLLIRNERAYDGKNAFKLNSLVVQSERLKTVLGEVLINYPGISSTALKRLEFKPPFECFVHRWEHFLKVMHEEEEEDTKKHLNLLHEVLQKELGDAISDRNDLLKLGIARYDTIWTLFEPGCMVFSLNDFSGCERVYKFKRGSFRHSQEIGPHYALSCQYVEFDGETFGYKNEILVIPLFGGTIDISKLPVYPLDFHPNKQALKERLLARGRTFEGLRGYHFKNYEGTGILETFCGRLKYSIHGRVILDTHAYNRFNPNFQVRLSSSIDQADDYDQSKHQDNNDPYNHIMDFHYNDGMGGLSCTPTTKRKADIKLTDDQRLIATHELRGYSLKDKKWFILSVPDVKEIAWNGDAFTSLVAPKEQKDLILAFARSQMQNKNTFDDVIQGKGRGIIMLLSGPPGVGKTLTAESVAEAMKVPLYMMSAGDLGTTPGEVEEFLSKILELNTKWNAVLLIDEADVFLEARSSEDLERNKLVSIFLRLLEYYEGILFLTTNRIENIDAAFESRIHLSLQYDDLDTSSRRHVWKTFLSRVGENSNFTEESFDKLAEYGLNGRQIKNVIKTASLLASDRGLPLTIADVNTVIKIRLANETKIGNWSGVRKE